MTEEQTTGGAEKEGLGEVDVMVLFLMGWFFSLASLLIVRASIYVSHDIPVWTEPYLVIASLSIPFVLVAGVDAHIRVTHRD